jgi:hypothetical protein
LKNNLEIKKISKLKTQRAYDKPTVRLFQGELIPESIIPQQLGIGPMNAFGLGFLDAVMAVWQNLETKKTIITGSEGQGNCVKICEGSSHEDAVCQLADKEKAKEVYTEFGLSFIESFRAFIKILAIERLLNSLKPTKLSWKRRLQLLMRSLKIR